MGILFKKIPTRPTLEKRCRQVRVDVSILKIEQSTLFNAYAVTVL